ncbi:hypothetical protein J5X98_14520 [Leptothermofonsia sichuanensis E412]|uniref:hypothetical protein n=1 Tax=Leptothermofonsia sichuanensis TaxID=2917832 RepID=UPI001CA72157|nr:hypothetical protein [Leptothermofonsia sichuanensis]QZZ18690.1 hypothetical protein J5X98_14520 [Leptothermofonsia sichuanensis E412]
MASQPSNATTLYERSFFDDFGYETDNFYEALAALSGRELCVAIRNTKILQYYFATRHLKFPTWLSLHAELEEHHFQDSILPALTHHQEDSIKQASMISAIKHGIDRHLQYFENLLQEYESQREHVTFASPHPPAPSPRLGEGEPSHLKVPPPNWERDLG